jgi:hypothetical protein
MNAPIEAPNASDPPNTATTAHALLSPRRYGAFCIAT